MKLKNWFVVFAILTVLALAGRAIDNKAIGCVAGGFFSLWYAAKAVDRNEEEKFQAKWGWKNQALKERSDATR